MLSLFHLKNCLSISWRIQLIMSVCLFLYSLIALIWCYSSDYFFTASTRLLQNDLYLLERLNLHILFNCATSLLNFRRDLTELGIFKFFVYFYFPPITFSEDNIYWKNLLLHFLLEIGVRSHSSGTAGWETKLVNCQCFEVLWNKALIRTVVDAHA